MDDPRLIISTLALVVTLGVIRWFWRRRALGSIPSIGYTAPLLSYITGHRFQNQSEVFLEEGCQKYKSGVFKVAMPDYWLVVATGRQLIEDLRKAPDDVLSMAQAVNLFFQTDYTMGPEIENNPYHKQVLQSQLTRNLPLVFDDLREELLAALDDVIPAKVDEWVAISTRQALRQIICRTTNRVFVGATVCRNEDYQRLHIEFAVDVTKSGRLINRFPNFLKPVVGPLFTKLPEYTRREMIYLQPMIEERRQKMEEQGNDWKDKPNDMLMWLMEAATGEERSVENLSRRLLHVNFAALHTSSTAFTHALYHLASKPEYVEALRSEVEKVVAADGWTKAAIGKMRKVDSFLRESQRFNGINLLTMRRLVMKPFTFSNGVTVPPRAVVCCCSRATHADAENYPRADVFDGFRFVDELGDTKHELVSTSTEYLTWGHGRLACPGRFFAAMFLKTMLAQILVQYDVKLEDGQGFPPDTFFSAGCIPGTARVMFRKRR
ncbi:cytochrome P450 [Artomyces pyxidatus]|uniref:Cytochrome P450 n=1 Tax=Artomyces pyxidatus TaxID=48021 RepID=A0ACB8THF1_9AGAM|nr:cytochrome P450 [Artomyces pyxidatus]